MRLSLRSALVLGLVAPTLGGVVPRQSSSSGSSSSAGGGGEIAFLQALGQLGTTFVSDFIKNIPNLVQAFITSEAALTQDAETAFSEFTTAAESAASEAESAFSSAASGAASSKRDLVDRGRPVSVGRSEMEVKRNIVDRGSISNVAASSNSDVKRDLVPRGPTYNFTEPAFIFVVQCTGVGFTEDCLVFGSVPGQCVSHYTFNPPNSTAISSRFQHKVQSISTNTGGVCEFYHKKDCDKYFDDPGVTLSYEFDLALNNSGYSGDYDKSITSWRC